VSKLTGKQVNLTFDGVDVKVTKCTPKTTRELADTTDSGDYNSASGLIHRTQLAHTVSTELSIEGMFRLTSTSTLTALLAKCYNGNAAAAGTLKLDGATNYLSGNWDISDFEADLPIDNAVTFKATLKSNGVMTVGA
jgi:predicted secreted protein